MVEVATGVGARFQRLVVKGRTMPRDETPVGSFASRGKILAMLMHNELHHGTERAIGAHTAFVDELEAKLEQLREVARGSRSTEGDEAIRLLRYVDEMCTQTLIKLDGVSADGELRELRRAQVRRVLRMAEELEGLKPKLSGGK